MRSSCLVAFVSILILIFSCKDNETRDAIESEEILETEEVGERMELENGNISARVRETPEISSFSREFEEAELTDDYEDNEASYTIFAPTNNAYSTITQEDSDAGNDPANNDNTIQYLISTRKMTQEQIRDEIESSNGKFLLETLQGEELILMLDNNEILIRDGNGNQARIVRADIVASNGVIHVIDNILRPANIVSQ